LSESHIDFYRRWRRLARPYFVWQFAQFKPFIGSRVADLGCGLGNFTDLMVDKGLYLGLDSDAEVIREMQAEYKHRANVEFIESNITSAETFSLLAEKKVNTIFCSNILEHIEDDARALHNMVSVLPAGGTLCLLVPAIQQNFGSLDLLDGHFRRYTKSMIMRRVSDLAVSVEKIYYFNFIGSFAWFLKGRVLRQKVHYNENYVLMNLLIPFVSRIERAIYPFVGLSLIAVLRKK